MDDVVVSIEYSPILRERTIIKENDKDVPDKGSWQKVKSRLSTKEGQPLFLQEVDVSFFEKLYEACYGNVSDRTLYIDMKTTEEVFKEFKKMSDWYTDNNENDYRVRVRNLTAKLTSNDIVANEIEIVAKDLRKGLNDKITKGEKTYRFNKESVFQTLEGEIKNLDKWLSATPYDNDISVCVTGVYSSGKSTFINAIIGEDILETDDDPSTAAVFTIEKVDDEKKIGIEFCVNVNVNAPSYQRIKLLRDKKSQLLKPCETIEDSSIKEIINEELFKNLTEDKSISEQIKIVVSYINKKLKKQLDESENNKDKELLICSDVTIYYPFKLGGNIPVRICDTPGTNSTYRNDGEIIKKTLKDQKNSILITILAPTKSEDRAGNNLLFNIIDNAEKNNTYLDKSRLFFVWNQIDGNYSDKEGIDRKKTKTIQIEENEQDLHNTKTINLSEYPLFFVSSQRALSAKKLIKNPEDEKWKKSYKHSDVDINLSKECSMGWQTQELLNNAEEAFKNAEGNEYEQAYVMSGLYSVQNGISNYINKYASAIIADGRYRAIYKVVKAIESQLSLLHNEQEFAKKEAANDFINKKKELEEFIKNSCAAIKRNNSESKSNGGGLVEKLNEDILIKVKKVSNDCSLDGSLHLKKTNEENLRIATEQLSEFVYEIINKYKKRMDDAINDVFSTITEKLDQELQNKLPANIWDSIKEQVKKQIEVDHNVRLEGTPNKRFLLWLFMVKFSDFEAIATAEVNEATSSLRNSLMRLNETKNETIEKIKNIYLEKFENLSENLKSLKTKSNDEEEYLKYLEEMCDFVKYGKMYIENRIFK